MVGYPHSGREHGRGCRMLQIAELSVAAVSASSLAVPASLRAFMTALTAASEPTPGSGFLGGSRPEGREGAAGGIGDVNAIGWRGGNIK